jgi:hypothetical protein
MTVTAREASLSVVADAAADAVMRLERVKEWLDNLTPEEAQLWFKARQACDFLYVAVNKAEQREGQVDE